MRSAGLEYVEESSLRRTSVIRREGMGICYDRKLSFCGVEVYNAYTIGDCGAWGGVVVKALRC